MKQTGIHYGQAMRNIASGFSGMVSPVVYAWRKLIFTPLGSHIGINQLTNRIVDGDVDMSISEIRGVYTLYIQQNSIDEIEMDDYLNKLDQALKTLPE